MTPRVTITIEGLEGPAALRSAEAFRLIYAHAFAEPPYDETEDDVAAAFRRFSVQTRKPGFRAALARTGDGEAIGMAYGHPLGPDAVWWDELTEPVPDAMRREDGHRTFGLMELAVRGSWRGQGVARRVHGELLDAVDVERVLLNVHPASEAAQAAYRAWGYRKVGQARPGGSDADLHDVMLLDLRRDHL
ncbi:GNAT family N-acetyltransferase [Streptomyces sp. NBC_00102]|uniref:GNAT family N-acetyltransferase n=1 Tax=Streptomyces sp. NBC_00102 TaxID=2975652 RepID=UPI00225018A9|nr:GNAT family N-acetyltransferase [Streptomyces sp. NBC_00102]MCX5397846.1 GNAT family N-acetyltransferase [Streptomyces sp. NBC_00102]